MTSGEKYTAETITWLHRWTPGLFSFRTTRSKGFRFVPGQFARLGVQKFDQAGNASTVWRAYSMVSAHYDDFLEFYSIVVPNGEFTTELSRLTVGDTLFVEKTSYGFMTLARFEQGGAPGKDLWLLASGTGLAPFLSILSDPHTWESYENLVLVHSVRYSPELTYLDQIDAFNTGDLFGSFGCRLTYLPVVTREQIPGALNSRITSLVDDGRLEAAAGVDLDLDRSRIMLCGNPDMLRDTRKVLKKQGFRLSRSAQPGQIAVENYW